MSQSTGILHRPAWHIQLFRSPWWRYRWRNSGTMALQQERADTGWHLWWLQIPASVWMWSYFFSVPWRWLCLYNPICIGGLYVPAFKGWLCMVFWKLNALNMFSMTGMETAWMVRMWAYAQKGEKDYQDKSYNFFPPIVYLRHGCQLLFANNTHNIFSVVFYILAINI